MDTAPVNAETREKVRTKAGTEARGDLRRVLGAGIWVGLWVVIVLFAFALQVMPFLLVLVLVNLSFGLSSMAAMIIVPTVLFSMLGAACWYASVRYRRRPPQARISAPRGSGNPGDSLRGTGTWLLPYLRERHPR